MLRPRESRIGDGRLGSQPVDADLGRDQGCTEDAAGSGFFPSSSDSLSESLEVEPDSSKKLRVFLAATASLRTSLMDLYIQKIVVTRNAKVT